MNLQIFCSFYMILPPRDLCGRYGHFAAYAARFGAGRRDIILYSAPPHAYSSGCFSAPSFLPPSALFEAVNMALTKPNSTPFA